VDEPDPLRTFGANLRAARRGRGLTQEGVATAADMDMSYYGRLERAVIDPGVRTIVRVARALGVAPAALMDAVGATAPRNAPAICCAAGMIDDYPHRQTIPTRWKDNDVYGHVNNVEYYSYFDTIINEYLIRAGGLDILGGPVIGLCAESHCAFTAALVFPEPVEAGLRVAHLGTSSVRYEIGLFGDGGATPAATGWFVHVFVDRATRRPAPLPEAIRAALTPLEVSSS
jgi:acyl-CoA thioester hydrolase